MVDLRERYTVAEKERATARPETGLQKPRITVFHCVRALPDTDLLNSEDADISGVKMACSSMLKEIYLLKAFEAGADAVVVLTCSEGECRYVQGNLRAKKRVGRVKKLLDAIGWGGDRLSIAGLDHSDTATAERVVNELAVQLLEKEYNGIAS
jgi:coenzyme F420-reducing hydrogenase delta subunit